MEKLDETLKDLRIKMAEDPAFSVEEILERESGKSYEIYGEMELTGAFEKEGRIKVLVRLYECMAHQDVIEEAFEVFEDGVEERMSEVSSEIDIDDMDIYLIDAAYQEDIDDLCSGHKIG